MFLGNRQILKPSAREVPRVTLKPMCVIKVAGDGDCLFHALGFFACYDGAALRIEVADFMETHAAEQGGFEDEWLREVEKLRKNKWGGHTAIAAYTLLKQTRVTVHTMQGAGQRPLVEEMSHAAVFGKEALPMVDILYNNKDHYDALVEISDLTGAQPAFPQPPPPMYLNNKTAEEFPPLMPDAAGKKAKKKGLTAPRPAKKAKAKAAAKPKAKAAATKTQPKKPDLDAQSDEEDNKAPCATASLSQSEETEEDAGKPGLLEELEKIPVAAMSTHPHRKLEDEIQDNGAVLWFHVAVKPMPARCKFVGRKWCVFGDHLIGRPY